MVFGVYTAVPSGRLQTTPWKDVFTGPSSLVCQETVAIEAFGFAAMPAGTCGT
jgi:hypothetical protein